ncbi:MAG: DNA-binding protein WhiA [Mycoplasmataceae bacterium]|nr:DNA-binding protein WhiA [Mycoplasmataceae bacterium]
MNSNKKSFTSFIRNEIINYNWTKEQLGILFFSFLKTIGTLKDDKYIFKTSLIEHEDKINKLFKEFYSLELIPSKTKNFLKYEVCNEDSIDLFLSEFESKILKNSKENKSYIAGAFLGKGWISSSNSRFYHCEFRVKDLSHSLDIQEVINGFGVKTSTTLKDNWYYTYIKRATDISTIISSFNASQALMIFEDSRIERDFVSTFRKMESIEGYNLKKIENSARKQIDIIDKIFLEGKENLLSDNQIKIAKLRIEKPKYSLLELQMEFNFRFEQDVSKSTINFWLKKIIEIY